MPRPYITCSPAFACGCAPTPAHCPPPTSLLPQKPRDPWYGLRRISSTPPVNRVTPRSRTIAVPRSRRTRVIEGCAAGHAAMVAAVQAGRISRGQRASISATLKDATEAARVGTEEATRGDLAVSVRTHPGRATVHRVPTATPSRRAADTDPATRRRRHAQGDRAIIG